MPKVEEKVLEWIEKNLMTIVTVSGTLLSFFIRYAFKDKVTVDYAKFLEPWYNEIQRGGIQALSHQVGNYNVLYQLCIAVMTYFPISPLYAYKIFSCIFDYLLAAMTAMVVCSVSDGQNKKNLSVMAYFSVLYSPIVILNSSAWAQCDAIYVFWIIAAIYALLKEKYLVSFILLGMSFSFKLQAVFILPFFLFVYFVKRKFSILYFIAIPVMIIITSIPAVFFGRNVLASFKVYFHQISEYKQVTLEYPSFWTILFEPESTYYYNMQKPAAIMLTIVILAALMISWIVHKAELSKKNMVYMAFILSYTCVLFLPQMHERYGYMYEILAIIVALLNRKTIALLVPLYILTLTTYGKYLFALSYNINVYSGIANVIVWLGYLYLLSKEIFNKAAEDILL